jgi:hypothetical protein
MVQLPTVIAHVFCWRAFVAVRRSRVWLRTWAQCGLIILALLPAPSCRHTPQSGGQAPSDSVDLLQELQKAEVRPRPPAPDTVRVVMADVAGRSMRSLSVRVPTRVAFAAVRIPNHATLSTFLAVQSHGASDGGGGVEFRLGISDGRTYEQLLEHSILVGIRQEWFPVQVDLSRYAGWQWSLFYHPSRLTWSLVLNSYPVGPGSGDLRALWATPVIQGRNQ